MNIFFLFIFEYFKENLKLILINQKLIEKKRFLENLNNVAFRLYVIINFNEVISI